MIKICNRNVAYILIFLFCFNVRFGLVAILIGIDISYIKFINKTGKYHNYGSSEVRFITQMKYVSIPVEKHNITNSN